MEIAKDDSPDEQGLKPPDVRPADSVLFGPHGLRAGWRLTLYISLYYALRFLVLTPAAPFFGHDGLPQLWAYLVYECLLVIIAMAPALFMSRLEQRPFGAYGVPAQGAFGKNFWAGAVWGFVAITVLILTLRVLGVVAFGGFALHGIRILKFAVFWAVLFLAVGFREDFLFRGYNLFTLGDGIGFWPAAFVMAACFGYVHKGNPGEGWAGMVGAAVIGLFFSFTLRRTGSLWFAIGMHMSWDWSETYFYSVPDSGLVLPGHLLKTSLQGPNWLSGGSVGPEGSVLLFVLIAVMWIAFDRLYPRVRYPRCDKLETVDKSLSSNLDVRSI
jgi:CAAX protease family protein